MNYPFNLWPSILGFELKLLKLTVLEKEEVSSLNLCPTVLCAQVCLTLTNQATESCQNPVEILLCPVWFTVEEI